MITRVSTAPPVLCTTLRAAFSDVASDEDITSTTAIDAMPESRPTTAATIQSAFSHSGLTTRIPNPVIAKTVGYQRQDQCQRPRNRTQPQHTRRHDRPEQGRRGEDREDQRGGEGTSAECDTDERKDHGRGGQVIRDPEAHALGGRGDEIPSASRCARHSTKLQATETCPGRRRPHEAISAKPCRARARHRPDRVDGMGWGFLAATSGVTSGISRLMLAIAQIAAASVDSAGRDRRELVRESSRWRFRCRCSSAVSCWCRA